MVGPDIMYSEHVQGSNSRMICASFDPWIKKTAPMARENKTRQGKTWQDRILDSTYNYLGAGGTQQVL
eukprot:12724273-Ditylum_brightwellii.AAC.1